MASAWFEINLLLAERGRGRLRIVRLAIVAIVAIKSNAKYYIMGVYARSAVVYYILYHEY